MAAVLGGYVCAWKTGGVSLLRREGAGKEFVPVGELPLRPIAPLCVAPDQVTLCISCEQRVEVHSIAAGFTRSRTIDGEYACGATNESLFLYDAARGVVQKTGLFDLDPVRQVFDLTAVFDEVELDGVVAEWLGWGDVALLSLSSPNLTAIVEFSSRGAARILREVFAVAAHADRVILSGERGHYAIMNRSGATVALPGLLGEAAVEATDDYPHFWSDACIVHLRSGRVGSVCDGESPWRDHELVWTGGIPDFISTNWVDRRHIWTTAATSSRLWEVSLGT